MASTPSIVGGSSIIIIKPLPFKSATCQKLITALDDEVETLYPDAADFPYEGQGTWLNGVPDVANVPGNDDRKGDATTATASGVVINNDLVHEAVWQNEDPADMEHAESKKELFFFGAFPRRSTSTTDGNGGERGAEQDAVGCVGIRLLPHFPLHREVHDEDTIADVTIAESGTSSASQGFVWPQLRTAELKRMYVAPEWRGRLSTPSASGPLRLGTGEETGTSVASLLLIHVEGFARQHMEIQRLVLETGARQLAAMKLYSRAGWIRCKDFGDYVGAGEDVGGLSRCYEKIL